MFFILAIKLGYQHPARLSPPAATNARQMVKRQRYCGVCQTEWDSYVEFLCLDGIAKLMPGCLCNLLKVLQRHLRL